MLLGDQARTLLTSEHQRPAGGDPVPGEDGAGSGLGLSVVAWCGVRSWSRTLCQSSERSWLAEHILPADQRWALLRRCLTDAQLSTPLRVAGSLVLLYGQTPTRIVTLTQHDVTRLDGMT